MKRKIKWVNYLIDLSILFSHFAVLNTQAAEAERDIDRVLYENHFQTGTAADLAEFESDDLYFPGYTQEFANAINNREYVKSDDTPTFTYVFQNIQKVELNNEVGIRTPVGTGSDYEKILKAVYDGIKAGNPDALVVSTGSSVRNKDDEQCKIC